MAGVKSFTLAREKIRGHIRRTGHSPRAVGIVSDQRQGVRKIKPLLMFPNREIWRCVNQTHRPSTPRPKPCGDGAKIP